MIVREYIDARDRQAVVSLWKQAFGYSSPHNDPLFAIDQKLKFGDGLFFVATETDELLGTVMAGYDGHRGWIYSLAVIPGRRNHGVGAALLRQAESALVAKGCPKVNLQILDTNAATIGFYEKQGYIVEPRISMGKKLHPPAKPR